VAIRIGDAEVKFRIQCWLGDVLDMMFISGILDHLGVLLDPIKQSQPVGNCMWNFEWNGCRIELCYALLIALSSFSVLKNSYWFQLPQVQGIGGREYMAAIQIVPVHAATNSRQSQFQSARTRCVNPSQDIDHQVRVFWDEVFVFEVKSGVRLLRILFSGQFC